MKAAQKRGDVDDTFNDLWSGISTACFICDADLPAGGDRPHTLFLNDKTNRGQLLALPICGQCKSLPQLVRLNRCTRLLRKMWSRPGGPQVHFR